MPSGEPPPINLPIRVHGVNTGNMPYMTSAGGKTCESEECMIGQLVKLVAGLGVLGVIGPTRLNYARIVPMVDYTAQVVSKLIG